MPPGARRGPCISQGLRWSRPGVGGGPKWRAICEVWVHINTYEEATHTELIIENRGT